MHFKRRGRHRRNDGSSPKRRQREKRLFKRLDRRRKRYEGKKILLEEISAVCTGLSA